MAQQINIGPEVERQLNQVGIFTYEDLKTMGLSRLGLKYNKWTAQHYT
jgi:hypothetical protein